MVLLKGPDTYKNTVLELQQTESVEVFFYT